MKGMRFIGAAMLAAALAAPASAQDPEQRIASALERARAAGLPVQLLESRIAEGRAKGLPMDRIAFAVEQRAAGLERASQALAAALGEEEVTEQDVGLGADALEAGVSEAVLGQIAVTSGRERRTVAIAALTYLVAEGTVPEEALNRVKDALARGDDALLNLPAAARGAGAGGPPAAVPAAGRPTGTGRPGGGPGGF